MYTQMYTHWSLKSIMQALFGLYTISMKYLFKRSNRNTHYYKRRVPKDLQSHYPKPFIEISLKKNDKSIAVALCEIQHKKIEKEFSRLRQGLPKEQVITDYQKTLNKLNEYNLTPQDSVNRNNDAELARDRFYESIDDTIYERTTPEEYTALQANHTALPLHLLSTQQRDALAIIQGTFRLSSSQYPSEYLRLLGKTENKKSHCRM